MNILSSSLSAIAYSLVSISFVNITPDTAIKKDNIHPVWKMKNGLPNSVVMAIKTEATNYPTKPKAFP